jgi:hypothetical protein
MKALKKIAKDLLTRMQLPPLAKGVLRGDEGPQTGADPGPARIIDEGIAWLGRAQDRSASQDGGVARHFSLLNGWATSYPETTGYIIPTMIAYGQETGSADAIVRARRMLDWLVAIQFSEGGFQGGMVHQVPRVPVTFNTGQILMGLAAGAILDPRYCEPMRKAADWLVATQDADGCWRKHPTPFAAAGEKTYETHVALGLMDAATVNGNRGYLEAALKQVDWALANQAANGWLAQCCLEDPKYPLTHTLGYALRGLVGAFLASRQERYLKAACLTADGLMMALKHDGSMSGRLDAQWGSAVDWVCLTGSSQIAHCWLLLHRETGRADYLAAGLAANAYVRKKIALNGPDDIRGGVKGSFPVNGGYGTWQYLNWACKFTIDANREELKVASADTIRRR